MSQFLYKTRCPACAAQGKDRSGDNLGVYGDGHTYCFSCGGGSAGSVRARLHESTKEAKPIPDLPEDVSTNIGASAAEWLLRYFPSTQQAPTHLWSEATQKLIFPIFDEGGMIAWQYRYFGDNPDHPKWVGYGINDKLFHIEGNVGDSLVLVEDLISACKVGHITPTMPLFGSHIGFKRLARMKVLGITSVTIWLDDDKKEYAIKAASEAAMLGLQTSVIHTKKDPKEYTFEQIRKIVLK